MREVFVISAALWMWLVFSLILGFGAGWDAFLACWGVLAFILLISLPILIPLLVFG